MYRKPTKEDILAARGKNVPDLIAPELLVLFCGINPGLYSAATGHHFARPGNRFWPAMYRSGFTSRLMHPWEEHELLTYGYGITNLADRATNSADEISREELQSGREVLSEKIKVYRPQVLAVLGIGAYRMAFNQPKATIGPQRERMHQTAIWVLPNPSGLNAHYTPQQLASIFETLRISLHK